jgi:hypothetical protein
MTRYQQKKKTYEEVLRVDFDHMKIVISADGGAGDNPPLPHAHACVVYKGLSLSPTDGAFACICLQLLECWLAQRHCIAVVGCR